MTSSNITSSTTPPSTTAPECQKSSTLGRDYRGKVSVTVSGRSCQAWTSTTPHEPTYQPEGEASNFCR